MEVLYASILDCRRSSSFRLALVSAIFAIVSCISGSVKSMVVAFDSDVWSVVSVLFAGLYRAVRCVSTSVSDR